jgi:exodeoxyribonuclease V gamma subunit
LENLANKFSEQTRSHTNVFGTNLVITQTEGMGSWLAIEVAKNNGIFANHCFENPGAFINRIFKLADLRGDARYGKQNLRWMIFSLLGKDEFIQRFPLVSNYYENDKLKRFQLATEVADVFDQYMIYRPDYIEIWNEGESVTCDGDADSAFSKHEAWQSYLWRDLKMTYPNLGLDRVDLKNRLLEKLKDKDFQQRIKDEFSQLAFFGLSVISNYHMDIYKALGQIIELSFYVVNPSPESHWYKKTEALRLVDNELFDCYNALGKDSFSLLMLNENIRLDVLKTEMPRPNTLLGKIQNDIYCNSTSDRNRIEDHDLADESICVASSFTPVRELESLYNYLLHIFEKEPTIKACDVVVQLTDVEKYAPYIKAVFDQALVSIPYSISDQSYKTDDSIVGILDKLLSLQEDDFTSETIVQLLDSHFVRNKFGISNLDFVRDLIRDANIHLGIEGRKEDDTRFVSWQYGLQRMLLAYAMKGGAEYQSYDDSLFPLDTFEGSEAYEMLRLKAFVDQLIVMLDKRKDAKTLNKWKAYVLDEVLEALIEFDEDSNEEYKYIINHLNGLDHLDDVVDEEIDFSVFYRSFNLDLFSENRKGGFVNGKLSFCSMIPMRSIPFKILAMLGLDSDKLPRKSQDRGFDLMSFQKRLGDRNTKANDRYLFLESILSARKFLYLSYIGNSVKNNSEQAPSLLVDELLSYIQLENTKAKTRLITKHPMHSFSKKYNSEDPKFYSYLGRWKEEEKTSESKQLGADEKIDLSSIDIKDLINFCKDPFKYYYNKVLRIYYNQDDVLLAETELFELDHLQQYQVKMDLLKTPDEEMNTYVDKGKKTGYLPLANMGGISMKTARKEIDELRNQWKIATHEEEETCLSIDLSWNNECVGELQFSASIDHIYGDKHLCVNVSKVSSREKYLVEAWIKHLALMADSRGIDTVFMASYYEKPLVFSASMMSAELADARLQSLLASFCLGHERVIPFLPKQGYELLSKKGDNEDKALDRIKKEGLPSENKAWFNAYIANEIDNGIFAMPEYQEKDREVFSRMSEDLFSCIISNDLF